MDNGNKHNQQQKNMTASYKQTNNQNTFIFNKKLSLVNENVILKMVRMLIFF